MQRIFLPVGVALMACAVFTITSQIIQILDFLDDVPTRYLFQTVATSFTTLSALLILGAAVSLIAENVSPENSPWGDRALGACLAIAVVISLTAIYRGIDPPGSRSFGEQGGGMIGPSGEQRLATALGAAGTLALAGTATFIMGMALRGRLDGFSAEDDDSEELELPDEEILATDVE